ncbi:MAG: leucine-rich repeat domain-containing protein [Oscillospiraceae bacterium]|nr:leucine-rich repeat domain-containing protein [Oscillospiraceae bacterium]
MNLQEQGWRITDGILTEYTGPGGDLVVPDIVNEMAKNVFRGNTKLKSIVLPGRFIGLDFANCTELEHVTLLGKDSVFLPHTFYKCYSLKDIVLPEKQEDIAQYCFYHCKSLQHIATPQLKRINKAAFSGCLSLQALDLPPTLRSISYRAFYECESLTEVIVPESVERIGEQAFARCKGLKHVVLPRSLKLGDAVFFNCPELSAQGIEWPDHSLKEKEALLQIQNYSLNLEKLAYDPIYQEFEFSYFSKVK